MKSSTSSVSSSSSSFTKTAAATRRDLRARARRAGVILPTAGAGPDEEAIFSEQGNTHLWLVQRAADLIRDEGPAGALAYELVQPGRGRCGEAAHDALCQGLYEADHRAPYN